ncbi:MAG TPA: alpha/beta hydrolase [Actinocrinis sp.]|nr:alpha/beta hydrolase [Actinocrinis sp.]
MPTDPQVQALRERTVAAGSTPLYRLSLDEARARDLADIKAAGGDPEPVDVVLDDQVAGPAGPLAVRVYRPAADGPLPVLVYFYGGGWTLGNLETCDAICRRLANSTPCVVVSASYRLAPEHPFPAAVDDCFVATQEIVDRAQSYGGDAKRVAVGGDSAGGNLAAVVALLARDQKDGVELAAQLLVYPNTDSLAETPSMAENDDSAFFNARSVAWYRSHYLADPADAANPLVSPLRAEDLAGLPPALVITAELDPLRDEGEQYAARLADSGVPTRLSRYDGMIHGFFAMSGVLDAGGRALAEAAGFLRQTLGSDS